MIGCCSVLLIRWVNSICFTPVHVLAGCVSDLGECIDFVGKGGHMYVLFSTRNSY